MWIWTTDAVAAIRHDRLSQATRRRGGRREDRERRVRLRPPEPAAGILSGRTRLGAGRGVEDRGGEPLCAADLPDTFIPATSAAESANQEAIR
jgi:hypothetical protein